MYIQKLSNSWDVFHKQIFQLPPCKTYDLHTLKRFSILLFFFSFVKPKVKKTKIAFKIYIFRRTLKATQWYKHGLGLSSQLITKEYEANTPHKEKELG